MVVVVFWFVFFVFKQDTSYEWRISDCSSGVCSSDLKGALHLQLSRDEDAERRASGAQRLADPDLRLAGTAQEGGAQGPPDAEARGAALSHPARLLEPRRRDPRPLLRHRHHRRGREAARAPLYRDRARG